MLKIGLAEPWSLPVLEYPFQLFENLEDGVTAKEFTEIFPGVRLEQVRAVLDFAAKNSLTFA